jgi:hypothetical protein
VQNTSASGCRYYGDLPNPIEETSPANGFTPVGHHDNRAWGTHGKHRNTIVDSAYEIILYLARHTNRAGVGIIQ